MPADIRDLMYDITNWRLTPSHALQTILDAAALLPVIGSIKYTDEAVDVVKGVLKRGNDVAVLDKNLKPDELLKELANSGVKYNLEDVVLVKKNYDGVLLWLEMGNSSSGLTHILEEHATNFAKRGISDIPQLLNDILRTRPAKYGSNSRGFFAEYIFNDNAYRIAYGTNGYIVSFFPID